MMNKPVLISIFVALIALTGCSIDSQAEGTVSGGENNPVNETNFEETDIEKDISSIIQVSKLSKDEQFELKVEINTATSKVYKSVKYLGDNDVEIISALPRVDVKANNTDYVFLFKRVATNLQPMETITEELSLGDLTGENKINVLAKFSIGDHGEEYEIEITDIEVDFKGDNSDS